MLPYEASKVNTKRTDQIRQCEGQYDARLSSFSEQVAVDRRPPYRAGQNTTRSFASFVSQQHLGSFQFVFDDWSWLTSSVRHCSYWLLFLDIEFHTFCTVIFLIPHPFPTCKTLSMDEVPDLSGDYINYPLTVTALRLYSRC